MSGSADPTLKKILQIFGIYSLNNSRAEIYLPTGCPPPPLKNKD